MSFIWLPGSALGASWSADPNSDGQTNVADVMVSTLHALEIPVSDQLDENGTPELCEGVPLSSKVWGSGTELSPSGYPSIRQRVIFLVPRVYSLVPPRLPLPGIPSLLSHQSIQGFP
jgi:hypothetical protein